MIGSGRYILIDGKPKLEPDLYAWARWMKTAERRVDQTTVGKLWVSTVFLTADHNWTGKGEPILWETMVFPDNEDNGEHFRRYTSLADAKKGHWEIVDELRRKHAEASA